MSKINISVVSYLNSKPFIFGIKHSGLLNQIDFTLDNPAVCAQKLLEGKTDIGLVPVAIIPQLKECYIISDYCIGAVNPVTSVMLFSNVPVENIKQVMLDHQSRTSVQLFKILARQHWKIDPAWIDAVSGFEDTISGEKAAVVIGDRALAMNGKFPYQYDLAEAWIEMTGLPFVFACWVSVKKLSDDFVSSFNKSMQFGLDNRKKVIEEAVIHSGMSAAELNKYLYEAISYDFDDRKKKGLNRFLQYLAV